MYEDMIRYPFIREERFFCTLLMTAVMKEPKVLRELFSIPIKDGESFEIYNETSILRDHWSYLGKTINSKREETNNARTMYLQYLCKKLNINFQKMEKLPCYYSHNRCGEKQFVNSPSNYPSKETGDDSDLNNLRALFNMRQDLLIIFRDTLYFIEAKLESANSRSQINNILLLDKLLDKEKECWAGLDSFSGIKNVDFFYIKKTDTPLQVDLEAQNQIKVITWANVFKVIKPVIRELRGVNIDKLKII